MIARFRQLLEKEGSTRGVALMRVGLVLVAWSRFASEVAPYHAPLDPWRWALAISFFASTSMMLVGWYTRVATAWAGVTVMVIVYGCGVFGEMDSWSAHHTTLLAHTMLLMAFTPCGRSYSLDRWVDLRRAENDASSPPAERGPLWGQILIGVQVSVVYLFSVLDKLQPAFLRGERLEALAMEYYFGADYPSLPGWHVLMVLCAITVILLEYLLGVALWSKRWQRILIPLGIALHAGFYVLLPVSTFSVTVVILYLAYLDPDDVHRTLDQLSAPS